MKLIAEIGWNHMGDINLAKEMINKASESGASVVKFQTWSVKDLSMVLGTKMAEEKSRFLQSYLLTIIKS